MVGFCARTDETAREKGREREREIGLGELANIVILGVLIPGLATFLCFFCLRFQLQKLFTILFAILFANFEVFVR